MYPIFFKTEKDNVIISVLNIMLFWDLKFNRVIYWKIKKNVKKTHIYWYDAAITHIYHVVNIHIFVINQQN